MTSNGRRCHGSRKPGHNPGPCTLAQHSARVPGGTPAVSVGLCCLQPVTQAHTEDLGSLGPRLSVVVQFELGLCPRVRRLRGGRATDGRWPGHSPPLLCVPRAPRCPLPSPCFTWPRGQGQRVGFQHEGRGSGHSGHEDLMAEVLRVPRTESSVPGTGLGDLRTTGTTFPSLRILTP